MPQIEPITSHANNISAAIFRVCRLVKHKRLREELEASAVSLVKDININNIDSTERLVHFAKSVGEMGEVNASVLCRELGNLRDMVTARNVELPEQTAIVEIEDIFTAKYTKEPAEVESHSTVRAHKTPNRRSNGRQTAILSFIRQFPNDCQMKDLVKEFSDVSERTLRNDIQKLIKNGKLERLGGKSGPFSYFKVLGESRNESLRSAAADKEAEAVEERILLPSAEMSSRPVSN